MGLGLLGRGIGDTAFLAECGADLIVTDLKSAEELASSVEKLRAFSNITFVLGEHRLQDFQGRDFILKAAGVPLDSIYIEEARRHNIPIEMSTALFASLTPATIVGITGTRGKSTVTHLLHSVLEQAYQGSKTHIFLGGNVRDVSTLPFLSQTKKGDIAVLELDSWQLQGFADKKISPHISIFTTFLPDHQNYYKNDIAQYFKDKAGIFSFQLPNDILIVGSQVAEQSLFKDIESSINSVVKKVDSSDFPKDWSVKMLGEHNKYNACLALAAARALEVKDEISKDVIASFTGVPGRLEFIKEVRSVRFYNDTNATTPDATLVALEALGTNKNIVLIMGGADKNLDMTMLLEKIPTRTKSVVLLSGTGTDRIKKWLPESEVVSTMNEAVTQALKNTSPGDIVLLSPAFASFGLFKNEFDRGEQFNASITLL